MIRILPIFLTVFLLAPPSGATDPVLETCKKFLREMAPGHIDTLLKIYPEVKEVVDEGKFTNEDEAVDAVLQRLREKNIETNDPVTRALAEMAAVRLIEQKQQEPQATQIKEKFKGVKTDTAGLVAAKLGGLDPDTRKKIEEDILPQLNANRSILEEAVRNTFPVAKVNEEEVQRTANAIRDGMLINIADNKGTIDLPMAEFIEKQTKDFEANIRNRMGLLRKNIDGEISRYALSVLGSRYTRGDRVDIKNELIARIDMGFLQKAEREPSWGNQLVASEQSLKQYYFSAIPNQESTRWNKEKKTIAASALADPSAKKQRSTTEILESMPKVSSATKQAFDDSAISRLERDLPESKRRGLPLLREQLETLDEFNKNFVGGELPPEMSALNELVKRNLAQLNILQAYKKIPSRRRRHIIDPSRTRKILAVWTEGDFYRKTAALSQFHRKMLYLRLVLGLDKNQTVSALNVTGKNPLQQVTDNTNTAMNALKKICGAECDGFRVELVKVMRDLPGKAEFGPPRESIFQRLKNEFTEEVFNDPRSWTPERFQDLLTVLDPIHNDIVYRLHILKHSPHRVASDLKFNNFEEIEKIESAALSDIRERLGLGTQFYRQGLKLAIKAIADVVRPQTRR